MPTPHESKEFLDTLKWRQKATDKMLQPSNCIASWTDICGFGSMLENNNWDLEKLQQANIVKLLNEFSSIAGRPLLVNIDPFPNDKIIILNDGIARTVDLKHIDKVNSYQFLIFLRDLITTHYLLLKITNNYSLGIRTVLAGGQRIQYSPEKTTGHSSLYYDSDKISDFGKKLLETTFVYNPIEFQMNTAFAKAFTIDNLGTKNGIKVNGFYIENGFIENIVGVNGLTINKENDRFKIFNGDNLVFELVIADELNKNIKGIDVKIYQIDKFLIYKVFDGDDLEFNLYEQ